MNFGHEIPKAPADRTNTLKGVGGGSSDGTTIAKIACRRYYCSALKSRSSLNRFRRNVSPPFRPTEYSNEQPIREPIVVNVANFNMPAGLFNENVINKISFTSGSERNDESQTARSINPKPP